MTIKKPDANPILAALLCLIFALGHFVVNGQQKKWLMILITQFVLSLTCCGGILILILSIMDAHATATKLRAGKEISEHEYSNALLFKIVRIIHEDAVLVLP
jgi:hypothetical protein